jgi:hypothetical protein
MTMAKHSNRRSYPKRLVLLAASLLPLWGDRARIRYGIGTAAAAATAEAAAAAARAGHPSDGDEA